jgi:hypothetical protein
MFGGYVGEAGALGTLPQALPVPPPNSIGVGWLAFTTWVPPLERAGWVEKLGRYFGGLRPRTQATRGYTTAWDVLEASTLSIHQDRPGELHVSIAQRDCEHLGWRRIAALYRWAAGGDRYNVTRLDLNYDDKAAVVTPGEVYKACEDKQLVSHQKVFREQRSVDGGHTTYLGSRLSESMTRVYRGDVVHGGDVAWVRWEAEWKGKTARHWGDKYFIDATQEMTTAAMVPTFWGALKATTDFKDRTVAVRPEDCPSLDWWDKLTAAAARRRGPRREVVPLTFQRSASWVINQVAPTLAYLVREVDLTGHGGYQWLDEVIDTGERRIKRRERVAAAAAGGMAPG